MEDNSSFSYVYVIVSESGSPMLVVKTEREAIEAIETGNIVWYDYFEVPYKHHN